jgi:hypothetical protein
VLPPCLSTNRSFWRTFGFHTISAIDTILDKDEFTLEELLDEEEILQEVKSQVGAALRALVVGLCSRRCMCVCVCMCDGSDDVVTNASQSPRHDTLSNALSAD